MKLDENYIDNFTYSIIEVFPANITEGEIDKRESYWKSVFLTRQFGLNNN